MVSKIPFPRIPFFSPSVGHVGPPYIATLTLPKLTIGLLVWLFSTLVNVNNPSASSIRTPPQDNQPHVYNHPSSPIGYYSYYSSFPSEISTTSNQVHKTKKRMNIKKKKNKLEGKNPTTIGHVGSDQPAIVNHVGSLDNVENSIKTHHKPKFPCRLSKGDHLLKDFPGIFKVVEVWYQGSQPASSVVVGHADDKPTTSDN